MRVLVVDDEALARDRLRRMLEAEGQHQVAGEASNGVQALQLCQTLRPELVLLDIRMPGMDGLETARHLAQLAEPPAVIFCTAYEEHAVAAFELQAVGYLLKPVRREKLMAVLAQARKLNRAQLSALREAGDGRRSHIAAPTHRGMELIPVEDIRYFQADQKYVTVRTGQGEIIVDETLRDLEEEFTQALIRVHRNALVARHFIAGLVKQADGQMAVRLDGVPELVTVSRRHLPGLRKLMKTL